jgi:hypothetical protein
MKNRILLLIIVAFTMFFTSCKVNTYYHEARYGNIVLDSLTRADVEIVGACTAEARIEKSSKGSLDGKYANQYKQGSFDDFISVATPSTAIRNKALAGVLSVFSGIANIAGGVVQDPGRDFVMYALFEKYPDVDYFAGVTIDRITTTKGKRIDEKLMVKAIGIKLKTDK